MCPALLRGFAFAPQPQHSHKAGAGVAPTSQMWELKLRKARWLAEALLLGHGWGQDWDSAPALTHPPLPFRLQSLLGSCVTPSLWCWREPLHAWLLSCRVGSCHRGRALSHWMWQSRGARTEWADPFQPLLLQSFLAEVNISPQRLERAWWCSLLASSSPPALDCCHITPRGHFPEALSW